MSCKSPFQASMMGFLVGMMGFLALVRAVEVAYRILGNDEPMVDEIAPSQVGAREQFRLAFEQVWKTIDTKHWESNPNGLDWKLIREEFAPRIAAATEAVEVDKILNEMLGRLEQSHVGVIPASQYEPIDSANDQSGSVGVALRMVEGKPTVWRVNPNSPASQHGVSPGWILKQWNSKVILDQLNKIDAIDSPSYSPSLLKQLVLSALDKGAIGKSAKFIWLNAMEEETVTELTYSEPAGKRAVLGHLPAVFVECNTRVVDGDVAYFQLSSFFDPPNVIPLFSSLLSEQANAPGLIIDLRGNPGGIAFMASSLGGFLVKDEGVYLGTMNTRDTTLRFTLTPREQIFPGKVAVLVDELSMSTSEILSGGLQDIGRARVFGRPSAGMALPSIVEKLAYGSGFQYAFASYTSAGGKALESNGVVPNESITLDGKSLIEGRDLDVEAAIRWIKSDKSVR